MSLIWQEEDPTSMSVSAPESDVVPWPKGTFEFDGFFQNWDQSRPSPAKYPKIFCKTGRGSDAERVFSQISPKLSLGTKMGPIFKLQCQSLVFCFRTLKASSPNF